MKSNKLNGAAMAMMVAGLFAMGAMTPIASAGSTVKCSGINSCKGTSACKTASSSCKGQNSCKGQGFTMQKTQASCDAAQAANKSA